VRSAVVAVALAAASLSTVAATAVRASASVIDPAQPVDVRVDAAKGRGDSLWARIPTVVGGTVSDMHGDTALVTVAYGQLGKLRAINGVSKVTLLSDLVKDPLRKNGDPNQPTDPGSLWNVAHNIGADAFWNEGYIGQGVDVAMIDTGVQPSSAFGDRLLEGPDLSFDPAGDGNDGYGHGTHLAGIIAGREDDLAVPNTPVPPVSTLDKAAWKAFDNGAKTKFAGIAPGSRIVNVRAGADNGAVDVSQVIAAIDWVVQHRNDTSIDPHLNIRVLNLAYGTDGTQSFRSDPLIAAVANAWRHGIVVVVSAGNDGGTGHGMLDNPAYDPIVLAAGASDPNGNSAKNNDTIADFSNNGSQSRRPDVIAPGTSLVSLAAPGSFADTTFPNARVGATLFRGTGTSQAAAVVSGAAALVLSKRPNLTPNQVKAVLTAGSAQIAGSGAPENPTTLKLKALDLAGSTAAIALADKHRLKTQNTATVLEKGDGSLELARGSYHIGYTDDNGVFQELVGEKTVTGDAWDGSTWRTAAFDGSTWRDEAFDASTWRGDWMGSTWRALGWAGSTWREVSWSASTWRWA
jgi:serine protease AprX